MGYSRWTDKSGQNMQKILDNIMGYEAWYDVDEDPYDKSKLKYNVEKVFSENQSIELNGSQVEFNMIKYEYEKLRPGATNESMRTARIQNLSGLVVIYSDGETTQYIINKSYTSNTLSTLRKINNCSKNSLITEDRYNVSEDFFMWMIYKFLDKPGQALDESEEIIIESIIGFKGQTDDQLAEMSGNGNKIMNLISSLLFLFENESVSQLKTTIRWKKKNSSECLELYLSSNNTIDTDIDKYTGQYIFEDDETRTANALLMISLEIIPKMMAVYTTEKDEGTWSEKTKKEFFVKMVGEKILTKLKEKLGYNQIEDADDFEC